MSTMSVDMLDVLDTLDMSMSTMSVDTLDVLDMLDMSMSWTSVDMLDTGQCPCPGCTDVHGHAGHGHVLDVRGHEICIQRDSAPFLVIQHFTHSFITMSPGPTLVTFLPIRLCHGTHLAAAVTQRI